MIKKVLPAITVYVVLFVLSFILSIICGLGVAESRHDPFSFLFYLRRIAMVGSAILMPLIAGQGSFFAGLGWKVSKKWILASIAVGIGIGFGNRGGFSPTSAVAIVLAAFHTFATELFFRGYLFTTMQESFSSSVPAVVLSSILYGLFYLTVAPIWAHGIAGRCMFVGLFSLLGVIFAVGYKRSGSFPVPWMMHFFGVLNYRLFV